MRNVSQVSLYSTELYILRCLCIDLHFRFAVGLQKIVLISFICFLYFFAILYFFSI